MCTTTCRLYAHYRTMERLLSKQKLTVPEYDPLDNQLDLFDQEINRLKGIKFNRDTLKSLHYGHTKKDKRTQGRSSI